MHKQKFLTTALIAFSCVVALSMGAAVAGHCDKKPNHPHCNGGGDPGGDHPVNLSFRDSSSDKIGSDFLGSGTTMYTDGEPGVSARLRDDGILLFNIDSTDRAIVLDFSIPTPGTECTENCKKDFDIASTDDYSPGAAATVQVFDNGGSQHRANNFLGMNIDEVLRGEMKIGFGSERPNARFSVRFQSIDQDPIDSFITSNSSFLEITRTSQDSWLVEAVETSTVGGGKQAALTSKYKQKGRVTQSEGAYEMPFQLTVICQSTCPVPAPN